MPVSAGSFNSLQVRYKRKFRKGLNLFKGLVSIPYRYATNRSVSWTGGNSTICFNSLQVRYKLSAAFFADLAVFGFNSLQVRYKHSDRSLSCRWISCFNSLQVRYKLSLRLPCHRLHIRVSIPYRYATNFICLTSFVFLAYSFNSLQVRYKPSQVITSSSPASTFQFLIGTLQTNSM